MIEGYAPKQKRKSRFFVLMSSLQAKTTLLTVLVVALLVTAGAFYMLQINTLSTKGYQLDALKGRVSELAEHNKQLELSVAELQSIKKIAERVESLDMVRVAVTDYLSPTGSSVAVR